MNDRFPEFFDQIRRRLKFVKAANADPRWHHQLEDLERRMESIASNPQHMELVDDLLRIVNRENVSLKQRLRAIGKALVEYRDQNGFYEN